MCSLEHLFICVRALCHIVTLCVMFVKQKWRIGRQTWEPCPLLICESFVIVKWLSVLNSSECANTEQCQLYNDIPVCLCARYNIATYCSFKKDLKHTAVKVFCLPSVSVYLAQACDFFFTVCCCIQAEGDVAGSRAECVAARRGDGSPRGASSGSWRLWDDSGAGCHAIRGRQSNRRFLRSGETWVMLFWC